MQNEKFKVQKSKIGNISCERFPFFSLHFAFLIEIWRLASQG